MQQNIFMANQLNSTKTDYAEMSISYWETLIEHR